MSKFDLVYEKALAFIGEKNYVESSFEDNIRLLIKTLKDNGYINPKKDIERVVHDVTNQPNDVKELNLDTQEQSLPAMKLKMKQTGDSESFAVTVINLENPAEPGDFNTFNNSMLETVFDDVIMFIKNTALQGAKPEAAVDELPPSEGANAQPGGGESALPQGEAPQQEQPPA